MLENIELRAKAREHLGGGIFQTMWLLTLVAIFVCDTIVIAGGYLILGAIILVGPMEYGLCRVLIATARGKKDVNFMSLFDAFKEDFGNVVLLGFLKELFTFLWSLLLIVPGIVKYYAYSMSTFIQQDAEDKTWKTCLDKSISMTYGYKWKLFCLDLSFIGWYIVGLLCLGVGVFFVEPYHEQARAEFYEELKKQNGVQNATGTAESQT